METDPRFVSRTQSLTLSIRVCVKPAGEVLFPTLTLHVNTAYPCLTDLVHRRRGFENKRCYETRQLAVLFLTGVGMLINLIRMRRLNSWWGFILPSATILACAGRAIDPDETQTDVWRAKRALSLTLSFDSYIKKMLCCLLMVFGFNTFS